MTRMGILMSLYIILALLILAELIFGNVMTLTSGLEETATRLGISTQEQAIRIYTLIFFDLITFFGAIITAVGLRRVSAQQVRIGSLVTLLGLCGYGIYQIISALFEVSHEYTISLTLIGGLYFLVGFFSFFAARLIAPRSLV